MAQEGQAKEENVQEQGTTQSFGQPADVALPSEEEQSQEGLSSRLEAIAQCCNLTKSGTASPSTCCCPTAEIVMAQSVPLTSSSRQISQSAEKTDNAQDAATVERINLALLSSPERGEPGTSGKDLEKWTPVGGSMGPRIK